MLNEKLYTYREFVLNEANNDIFTYVRMNNIEKIKQYIENDGELNIRLNGKNLLSYTIRSNPVSKSLPIIKLFIDSGADINYKNNDGTTALMVAISNSKIKIVTYLLQNNADVNSCNNKKQTALFYINTIQQIECARLLIEAGIDVNQQNDNGFKNDSGNTALMYYCSIYARVRLLPESKKIYLAIIEFLLTLPEIDLTIKNQNQMTAQDLVEGILDIEKMRNEILLKKRVIFASNKLVKNSGIF